MVWCEADFGKVNTRMGEGDLAKLFPPRAERPPLVDAASNALQCDAKALVSECVRVGGEALRSPGAPRITKEEAAAIALFTVDLGDTMAELNPHRLLAAALSQRNPAVLKRMRGLIAWVLGCMRALPRLRVASLFRGITQRVSAEQGYAEGRTVTWHSMASTTAEREAIVELLRDETTGDCEGTLFVIRGASGYDVTELSMFKEIPEVVIEPETEFTVLRVTDGPLVVVELQQIEGRLLLAESMPPVFNAATPIIPVALDVVPQATQAPINLSRSQKSARPEQHQRTPTRPEQLPPASAAPSEPLDPEEEKVVAELRAIADRSLAADQSAGSLLTLALSEGQQPETVAQKGETRLALGALSKHPKSVLVAVQACGALAGLAINPDNWPTLVQEGAISRLSALLRRYPFSAQIAERCCSALGKLSLKPESREEVVREGGIQLVLGVLKTHDQNRATCEKALTALMNMAISDENAVSIAREGGLPAVIDVMWKNSDSAVICAKASGVLWNCSFDQENKVAIAKAGGIASLLSGLPKHIDNPLVCENICAALCSLAINPDNKVSITKEGGILLIIAVLRRHTASPNACEHAAGALGNLATHPDSKNAIASQGGVAAVIGALRAHVSGSASVTQMCLGCLKNLANGSEVTRETMEREGAIAVIFEALSIHSGSVPLVDLGCGALRNLSQTPVLKALIKKLLASNKAVGKFKKKIF